MYYESSDPLPFDEAKEELVVLEKAAEQGNRPSWVMEERKMRYLEEGNLKFFEDFHALSSVDIHFQYANDDLFHQTKINIIISTALCCRAAMRGGLAPEIAYPLSGLYIRSADHATNHSELQKIHNTMLKDFSQRVHKHKLKQGMSLQVKLCHDYIQMHVTDSLDLDTLADAVGYSKYYLCHKFQEETGMTIQKYIHQERMEYAKQQLRLTKENVQDISDRLHYCNPSHFSSRFRAYTGMTPKEYREKNIQ